MTSTITDDSITQNTDAERSELNAEPVEVPRRRQVGQHVEVFLESGESFVVHVANPDRIAYEKVAAKHKWAPAAEAQNLAMTFVCWSAAKRAGLTTMPYEQWERVLLDYELVAEEAADPTRPTA